MKTAAPLPPRRARSRFGTTAVVAALLASLLGFGAGPAHAADAGEGVIVGGLRTNNAVTPLGVDDSPPRFSWQLESEARGAAQTAYQLRVAESAAALDGGAIWDSGRIESGESAHRPYGGPAFESQTRYHWQLRVWDQDGAETAWSEPSWFETGLFAPEEWEADWIGGPDAAEKMASWSDYRFTVEYTLEPGTAFAVFLRASDTANALMWQLNDEIPGTPKLRPHTKVGGGFALVGEVDLTSAGLPADVLTTRGTLEVTAQGGTVTTRVNDTVVDTRSVELPRFARGYVGFRTSASTTALESVVIHSVDVTPLAGPEPLLAADFSAGNPFTGGTLVEGGLELTGSHEVIVAVRDGHPLLRTEFEVPKEVASARVYATARGVYELSLNGAKVGDQQLAPGWTDYDTRIEYQSYDVTELIAPGANAFGAMLAPGWYSGRLAHIGDKNYGSRPSVIAQLRIDYVDGTHDVVATSGDWKTAPGPYAMADLIQGEEYFAEDERDGWDETGHDIAGWTDAWVAPGATGLLVAQQAPPVRVTEERPALERSEPTPGAWVYDIGQNMVGVVRVVLRGEAGQTVRLRFGEETYPDGSLYTANLRSARATDYYTFDEAGEVVYEPRFTFHGFRYVEVTGVTDPPEAHEMTGVVWGSDLERIGTLETSNALVNQLQSNIVWGQRGNFLSIPTDTPARDERMGWSGDINVFAPTASFNMDTLSFLAKWLVDLQDAQLPNGDYLGVAPYHPNLACCGGGTGWSDAGVTVPWALWQSYGDTTHIRDGWASMTRYMDYLAAANPTHVRGSTYADWLHLDDPTPGDVLGTAYYAYVADLMGEMAAAIGEDAEAEAYSVLSDEIAEVFRDRFIAADGAISGDSQAGYAIAIGMGLVTPELMERTSARFLGALERRDFHLSTGFLGTPWLVSSLAVSGNLDVAYRLLLNESYPSWGYEIAKGATTIWERWNSIMPDGSFGDVGMNSFNHYAYGAVGDWMYRSIGGIAPGAPGYKHAIIEPRPGGGITSAQASFDSVYGMYRTDWSASGDDFALDVTVPANATATVVMPAGSPAAVSEGGLPLTEAAGIGEVRAEGGGTRIEVGSGSYRFTVDGRSTALGELLDRVDAAAGAVDALHAGGRLDDDEHRLAADGLATARGHVLDVLAGLAGDGSAIEAELARLLETLDGLAADLAGLAGDGPAEALAEVEAVLVATGVATARLVGVSAELTPQLPATPGGSFALDLALQNTSGRVLTALESRLLLGAGWEATPEQAGLDRLNDGETARLAFRATSPASSGQGDIGELSALTRLTLGGHRLLVADGVRVALSSPVVIGEVGSAPDPVRPGSSVRLTVPVTNTGEVALTVHAEAALPANWNGTARSPQRVLAPGESTELVVTAAVPLGVTARPLAVPVTVVRSGAVLASAEAAVPVALDPVQYDVVDLGDTASEAAHGLTAHPSSGTSVEAGLSRRYSHGGVPGSWFEFDVSVPAGEPFAVRLVETYGSTGTKDYTVSANGVVVLERHNTSGPGTAEAFFMVDDPAISESGTVRLRFERGDPALGDPSIAHVWVYDTAVADHVDLGFGYSETRHSLSAAPSSATSFEAGHTRRYSGVHTPGSWFEFDLAVTPGEPFLLRMRETYDGPQNKEYSVSVDGTVVEERALPRPESGAGVQDYQVLVEDPALSGDGTVRVRFQKSQTGPERHDPSIADVWALGVPADTLAPVASAVVSSGHEGEAGWHRGLVTVALFAQDDRDGAPSIEYTLGGSDWETYTSPLSITADGVHTVGYRAIDAAGNTSDAGSVEARIDTVAPLATAVAEPGAVAGEWHPAGTAVSVAATDESSGVAAIQYRVGGSAWTPYTGPIPLADGTSVVEVRARDLAGNLGPVSALAVLVDATAPALEARVSGTEGAGGWLVENARVSLLASDEASGLAALEYRTGGEWRAYTAPVAVADGVTRVEYRARDAAGNVTADAAVEVRADGRAPELDWALGTDRLLMVSAHDDVSGVALVEYALGDGAWSVYGGPVTVGTEPQRLRLRAVDQAGNRSEIAGGLLAGGRISATLVSPGDRIEVTGAGFEPGETVRIELRSQPVLLATAVADAEGEVRAVVTIPADTSEGEHHIVLVGTSSGVEVWLPLAVNALTATGLAILPYVAGGGLLLALGLAALLLARRPGRPDSVGSSSKGQGA